MNEPDKDSARMIVTLTIAELGAITEAAIERANAKNKPVPTACVKTKPRAKFFPAMNIC